ncbi:MAG: hypothetical protein HQ541_15965 [Mariniphaga sp.]|nr:hypothetical protein [Mariniphaga sp.]
MEEAFEIKIHKGSFIKKHYPKGEHYVYCFEDATVVAPDVIENIENKNTTKQKRIILRKINDCELLEIQLNAKLGGISDKIEKDIILFGYSNPEDLAEKARIEFQLEKIKSEINELKTELEKLEGE